MSGSFELRKYWLSPLVYILQNKIRGWERIKLLGRNAKKLPKMVIFTTKYCKISQFLTFFPENVPKFNDFLNFGWKFYQKLSVFFGAQNNASGKK